MILIVCLDDNGGMMFNRRRQSRDSVLRSHMLEETASAHLWMSAYSAKQFSEDSAPQIIIDEAFMENAPTGDYCFLEDGAALPYIDKLEGLIAYKWGRKYPGDRYFDIELGTLNLIETQEFTGSSHEAITKEVYVK